MTCYRPVLGYRAEAINPDTRKRGVVFNPLKAVNSTSPLRFPCGKCRGCRLDRSEAWAVRICHEAQMHEANSFITLTYAPEHYPEDGSVSLRDLQLFLKRARKRTGKPLRYFACAEYGEENQRAHYHLCLHGEDFSADRVLHRKSEFGPVYKSALLSDLWKFGHHEIGNVTFKSAAYVSRYVTSVITGDKAASHYLREHPHSGQVVQVRPPFAVQSRNPGLGATWFDKYKGDAFPSDFLVVEGRKVAVPKFYLDMLEAMNVETVRHLPKYGITIKSTLYDDVLAKRVENARPHKWNNTFERLAVREEVRAARTKSLVRPL